MKILRITYEWPPPWDGLAPHPYELTLAQEKLGHTFDIFCGRWPKAGNLEKTKNSKIHTFWREPLNGLIFFTTSVFMFFYYLIWSEHHSYDVIHSHGHFGIWLYFYRSLIKRIFPWSLELKIPLVVHFHNTVAGRESALLDKNVEIKKISKKVSWPLAKFSDKLAVKAANACIFVSTQNKQEAEKFYGTDPGKCFVIESGVNTDLFTPVSYEEKEKTRVDLGLDTTNHDIVVLNHGVMVERKNIHLLVEAFKHLPENFKLLLAGSGDEKYLRTIDEFVIQNSLTKKVIRTGYVEYKNAPILYQSSDLFVLPSSFEGLPKVVTQGLACGISCLVSGFRLREEISGLYYLENTDPKHIASKINEVINANPVVDIHKVRRLYSWDVKAYEVEKVYEYVFKKEK